MGCDEVEAALLLGLSESGLPTIGPVPNEERTPLRSGVRWESVDILS